MRIVEIPSFFIPYGGEFCLEQSKALAALGHDVTILANVLVSAKRAPWTWLLASRHSKSMTMEGIRGMRFETRSLPRCLRPNMQRWVKKTRNLFGQYVTTHGKPDIIRAHCAKWAGYAASILSKEYGIPYIRHHRTPAIAVAQKGIWNTHRGHLADTHVEKRI